jgi:hypothetical protein
LGNAFDLVNQDVLKIGGVGIFATNAFVGGTAVESVSTHGLFTLIAKHGGFSFG